MNQDLASILTGGLAKSANVAAQQLDIAGTNAVQGLATVQTLGVQIAHQAAVSSAVQADDAQSVAGLRTAIHVPAKDG